MVKAIKVAAQISLLDGLQSVLDDTEKTANAMLRKAAILKIGRENTVT
jgi:hypothetical protein